MQRLQQDQQIRTFWSTLCSFSIPAAFEEMPKSRAKPWENTELDILENFRAITCVLFSLMTTAIALTIITGVTNPWKPFYLFTSPIYTLVVNGLIASEAFFTISAFLAFYHLTQIFQLKDKFSGIDIVKVFGKRLLSLLPLYYFVLLFGWFVGPRLADGPIWFSFN